MFHGVHNDSRESEKRTLLKIVVGVRWNERFGAQNSIGTDQCIVSCSPLDVIAFFDLASKGNLKIKEGNIYLRHIIF